MNEQNKPESWDEIRIAYHVARLGTLSAAAAYLGIHHATVIRQITSLEQRLGTTLFHRHPRGYTPTESGRDLMLVATQTDDLLNQLAGRVRGKSEEISGELIVTTANDMSSHITPMLIEFQQEHPLVQIILQVDDRLLRMEYGEAHVALRFGNKPQQPDNVVQPLGRHAVAPFAHDEYVKKYGEITDLADMKSHKFVLETVERATKPYNDWMRKHVPEDRVIFRASRAQNIVDVVMTGAAIGFFPRCEGLGNPDLVQVYPTQPEWEADLWLVTHVNLHRTAKVQALLKHFKARIPG